MLYEVKIYDRSGNLSNVVSSQELNKKSTNDLRSLLTKRDRAHIMSLEGTEQINSVDNYDMV